MKPGAVQTPPAPTTDSVTAMVRRWLAEAEEFPVDSSAAQLAGVLRDPKGLDFTVGFVDGVVRPEDLGVAARKLRKLGPQVPSFLPWYMRGAVRLGGGVAPIAPGIVIPIARRVLREMVGHLIVDATDAKLGPAIAKIRSESTRLNINLLGEAVLGEVEADRRLEGTMRLLRRPDVDYVSIKVSSTVAPHQPWAFDEAVEDVVAKLSPLFEYAASAGTPKFINLDMEEYKDLDLTIAVFTRILDRPELRNLEAGIVLQAYLPDALSAMIHLQEWSAARRAQGGAPIKVRVVKGANLPMEQVEASLHGWPLATWGTKQDSDTHYKRVLDYSLRPEHAENVRIGVAGHNLFDVAHAWQLAQHRGAAEGIEFEMLLGMAQGQAEAVKREVGSLLLYTPVVQPQEFDVAIAYLIRRLEEGASSENFMSAVFELTENKSLFRRERERFERSLEALGDTVPTTNRVQNRAQDVVPSWPGGFENTPDTDPALPGNRVWGREILNRIATSDLGIATVEASRLADIDAVDALIADTREAGRSWAALTGGQRAEILHSAGEALERHRARLMEISAVEAGKTLDQSDPEISEAIDFAHYYAELARGLDEVDGAVFSPVGLTVVTPPWNFPVAIPAGSTLAALAAGSPVIIKPASPVRRTGAVLVEALWEAGVPRDVLRMATMPDSAASSRLVSHPDVGRVILTGAYETAELFRSFRPELPLLAETSGKNALIVTPSADLDLAARDVVASAFGHAGQKCSAASLVILVGSVADSRRFRGQLLDAVRSLTVDYPSNPSAQMGPLIGAADGKLLDGLTRLGTGESWLVEPRQLDDSGALWSPGVREGVRPGSEYHMTEYFGPILGIMTARTLDEAIEMQNAVEYGLTAGIHSLDAEEIGTWLDRVQAGNLYVNRGITGAIVQRQPFGGWKKSAVGAGTKAGGPNYLVGLGDWTSRSSAASAPIAHSAIEQILRAAGSAGIDAAAHAGLERSARSDAAAWADEFGVSRDVSALLAERNVFRYLPVPVTVRGAADAEVADIVRTIIAGVRAGAAVTLSVPSALPDALQRAMVSAGVELRIEHDTDWFRRAAALPSGRIRVIGGSVEELARAVNGRPDLALYANPVTEAGRVEVLPYLHEQAVSITAHRFGTPDHLTDALI